MHLLDIPSPGYCTCSIRLRAAVHYTFEFQTRSQIIITCTFYLGHYCSVQTLHRIPSCYVYLALVSEVLRGRRCYYMTCVGPEHNLNELTAGLWLYVHNVIKPMRQWQHKIIETTKLQLHIGGATSSFSSQHVGISCSRTSENRT